MRDSSGGARAVTVTKDFGLSWTEHPTSGKALIEPVCMASLIVNPYANVLIFSDPEATDWRYNITVKARLDEGMTWPQDLTLVGRRKRMRIFLSDHGLCPPHRYSL